MKKLRRATSVLTIMVMGLGLLLVPQAAQATPVGRATVGFYQELRNSHTNKCADVASKSLTPGGIVHQWSCAHDDNQLWAVEPQPNGYVWLRNLRSQLCMAATFPYTIGGQVIQQVCAPELADIYWSIAIDGGLFKLVQPFVGMCLDLNRGSTSNGARIQIWTCETSSNAQHWYFA